MTRKPYPTDLTDAQWARLEPLLPRPKSGTGKGGRPPADRRDVVNAIFHHLRAGSSWALLPRLREVIADRGFSRRFVDWVRQVCGWAMTTTATAGKGFRVHPRRWVVERTFGWLVSYRRLGKDYERHPETSEAMIHAAMIHLMLRRLPPLG